MKSVENGHRLLRSPNPNGRLPSQRLSKLNSSSKTKTNACKVSNLKPAMATTGTQKSGFENGFGVGGGSGHNYSQRSQLKTTTPPPPEIITKLSPRPRRATRVEMLKIRFAPTIFKAKQTLHDIKLAAEKSKTLEEPIRRALRDVKRRTIEEPIRQALRNAKSHTLEEPIRRAPKNVKRYTTVKLIQIKRDVKRYTTEELIQINRDVKRCTIEEQRRVARDALEKVKQTVDFNENLTALREFEELIGR